jgi:DNA-binding response OmpR family regulator
LNTFRGNRVKGTAPVRVRFGPFELDANGGQLRLWDVAAGSNGQQIVLQEQPLRLLLMLIQNDGEIVTRDAIQKKFCPTTPSSSLTTVSTQPLTNSAGR